MSAFFLFALWSLYTCKRMRTNAEKVTTMVRCFSIPDAFCNDIIFVLQSRELNVFGASMLFRLNKVIKEMLYSMPINICIYELSDTIQATFSVNFIAASKNQNNSRNLIFLFNLSLLLGEWFLFNLHATMHCHSKCVFTLGHLDANRISYSKYIIGKYRVNDSQHLNL